MPDKLAQCHSATGRTNTTIQHAKQAPHPSTAGDPTWQKKGAEHCLGRSGFNPDRL